MARLTEKMEQVRSQQTGFGEEIEKQQKLQWELEKRLEQLGRGRIVDGVGRGFALDRDGNYAKVQKAYACMTQGKGTQYTL